MNIDQNVADVNYYKQNIADSRGNTTSISSSLLEIKVMKPNKMLSFNSMDSNLPGIE